MVGNRRRVYRFAIDFVASHGVAEFRNVDANLVSSTRLQSALNERVADQEFNRLDVRDGNLTACRRLCAAALSVAAIED